MSKRYEPEETHDKDFAPVTRGGDARGRTREGADRRENEVSGTGVPGVDADHPESAPPTEEGVEAAERDDATREH